jgi:glycosyltransferase involved in cell wall biosynthesis
MSEDTHLSVIIPAYNEERRLPGTLRSVSDFLSIQAYTSEIVVVDDGSTDRTEHVALGFKAGAIPVAVVNHPDRKNHGKGAAVQAGMLQAQGRYRLFMDADNSTGVEQVDKFWPYLSRGVDVGVGSRNTAGSVVMVHQAWFKEMAGRLGNLVIQRLAVPGIRDTQAGFKIFTGRSATDVFSRLTIHRWGYDVEALAIARALGYKVAEVPITWVNAPGSKVGFGSYFQVLAEVWRIRRNLKSGIYGVRPR